MWLTCFTLCSELCYMLLMTRSLQQRSWLWVLTSCRRAADSLRRGAISSVCTYNMPRPSPPSVGAEAPRAAEPNAPAYRNVAVGSHAQYLPTLTAAAAWRVNAVVNKAAWWPWPWPLTFDLENGVRVTCDVGYPCANFSLPRPLCSRLRPDVGDRQTSDRQTSDIIIA